VFTLENVSAEYVIVANRYGELPVYKLALPGISGKVSCDSPADIAVGLSWQETDSPSASLAGGKWPESAGWIEGYSQNWIKLDGKGVRIVELTVYEDGTLVSDEDKSAIACIQFFFGYPVAYDLYDMPLPDDLISWEWRDTTNPGAGAGGPPKIEHVSLPKHPVSELEYKGA
jgi:hypothetical protein